jgi:hypothetical protein
MCAGYGILQTLLAAGVPTTTAVRALRGATAGHYEFPSRLGEEEEEEEEERLASASLAADDPTGWFERDSCDRARASGDDLARFDDCQEGDCVAASSS